MYWVGLIFLFLIILVIYINSTQPQPPIQSSSVFVTTNNPNPFIYQDKLYYENSLEPHVIIDTETSSVIATTGEIASERLPVVSPILIKDRYVGLGKHNDFYFFYSFENKQPFKIIKFGPDFLLNESEDITFIEEKEGNIHVGSKMFETQKILSPSKNQEHYIFSDDKFLRC